MKERMNLTKSFGKASVLLLLLCFTTSTLVAQVQGRDAAKPKGAAKADISPYGKIEVSWFKLGWFVDLNCGTRMLGATSSAAKLGLGFSANGGIGYFFSDRFGLKGRMDYNRYTFSPGIGLMPEARGVAMSFSIEALTDIIPLVTGKTKFRDWRIELHGGVGYTSFANKAFKADRLKTNSDYFQNDPAIKGNDDMGHVIIGLTPQYHINGRWSINLDFSSFFLFKQDFTLDNYNGERFNGVGNISNLTLGITFRP
jgi:hypothetical protein